MNEKNDCPIRDKRLASQPIVLECGGKRSATPLWQGWLASESGVAASLCHRSPKSSRPATISGDTGRARSGRNQNTPQRRDEHREGTFPANLCVCPVSAVLFLFRKSAQAAAILADTGRLGICAAVCWVLPSMSSGHVRGSLAFRTHPEVAVQSTIAASHSAWPSWWRSSKPSFLQMRCISRFSASTVPVILASFSCRPT